LKDASFVVEMKAVTGTVFLSKIPIWGDSLHCMVHAGEVIRFLSCCFELFTDAKYLSSSKFLPKKQTK